MGFIKQQKLRKDGSASGIGLVYGIVQRMHFHLLNSCSADHELYFAFPPFLAELLSAFSNFSCEILILNFYFFHFFSLSPLFFVTSMIVGIFSKTIGKQIREMDFFGARSKTFYF